MWILSIALPSSPAIPMTVLSVLLAAAAILLIIGLFPPIVGTLVAVIESVFKSRPSPNLRSTRPESPNVLMGR